MRSGYRLLLASTVLATFAAVPGIATAAATNGQKCAAAKLKGAARYAACRLNADAKAATSGVAADYTKCDAKQLDTWSKADAKYGVECLTSGDQASAQTDLTDASDCMNSILTGTPGSCSFTQDPPCPPGGAVVDGTCWVMSASGDSCTAACALAGLAYDSATDTYLGTASGTIGNCLYVQTKLGYPHLASFNIGGPPQPIGCSNNGSAFLVGGSVTAQANFTGFARVCGCS
jgi:hypothetical protein